MLKKFHLTNLDCANCALKLEKGVRKVAGVQFVSIDFSTLTMEINALDMKGVLQMIHKLEPGVKVHSKPLLDKEDVAARVRFIREIITISIGLTLFLVGTVFQNQLRATPYSLGEYAVFIAAYLITGWNVLLSAFRNSLRGNVFDENFLMTVATVGAIAIHALSEAAMVMIFFKIGEFFQELSLNHSRKSIRSLMAVRPDTANLKTAEGIIVVPPENVKPGDIIVVKPGEKVPLDGLIMEGSTTLDTSALTGESRPRSVKAGDEVLAGVINQGGLIILQVRRAFEESSIAKILELVENAVHKKAKTERFISRFARVYTPAVVLLAALVAVIPPLVIPGASFQEWIYRALILLVISCPCALVISIPLGYFGGIGGASRKGILVKGSNYLDALNSVKMVVFDKTGTLTKGVFKVTEIHPEDGYLPEKILELAAMAESHSNHPIARSILESFGKAVDLNMVKDYEEIPGYGIKALVDGRHVMVGNDRFLHAENIHHARCCTEGTTVHVTSEGKYAGYLVISDEIKEGAPEAISHLRTKGIRTIMLTGDSHDSAATANGKLNLDEFYADLLPEQKVDVLEQLMTRLVKGGKLAFVGDGINDAPVIARAHVGIAMGIGGTDAAIDTADIVLMSESPSKVWDGIEAASKTKAIVWQNIVFALGVKAIFVVMGIFGFATMWEAVFADVGVALLAILNAARALH